MSPRRRVVAYLALVATCGGAGCSGSKRPHRWLEPAAGDISNTHEGDVVASSGAEAMKETGLTRTRILLRTDSGKAVVGATVLAPDGDPDEIDPEKIDNDDGEADKPVVSQVVVWATAAGSGSDRCAPSLRDSLDPALIAFAKGGSPVVAVDEPGAGVAGRAQYFVAGSGGRGVLAAVAYAEQRWPDAEVWLAGIADGAHRALGAAAQVDEGEHKIAGVVIGSPWISGVTGVIDGLNQAAAGRRKAVQALPDAVEALFVRMVGGIETAEGAKKSALTLDAQKWLDGLEASDDCTAASLPGRSLVARVVPPETAAALDADLALLDRPRLPVWVVWSRSDSYFNAPDAATTFASWCLGAAGGGWRELSGSRGDVVAGVYQSLGLLLDFSDTESFLPMCTPVD